MGFLPWPSSTTHERILTSPLCTTGALGDRRLVSGAGSTINHRESRPREFPFLPKLSNALQSRVDSANVIRLIGRYLVLHCLCHRVFSACPSLVHFSSVGDLDRSTTALRAFVSRFVSPFLPVYFTEHWHMLFHQRVGTAIFLPQCRRWQDCRQASCWLSITVACRSLGSSLCHLAGC